MSLLPTSKNNGQPDTSSDKPQGHWLQAGRLAFIALYILTSVTAISWLVSNIREIGPESRAVVLRFGAIDREQNSGLLLAWPQPFEKVIIIPSADRVVDRTVKALIRPKSADYSGLDSGILTDATAGEGYLLTGDSGIVQLGVHLYYKVTDPYAYVLQGKHVNFALDRLVERSAVVISASRDLDTILVARPELVGSSTKAAEEREKLREDLVKQINLRLAQLTQEHASLGIKVARVDIQPSLPVDTVDAFNAVLTASQLAKQAIAEANNKAASIIQAANQEADRILQEANANASERVANAQANTASIVKLAKAQQINADPGLLWRLYRQRITTLLSQAGSVSTVDPKDDAKLILQGKQP
ncbi:protease modulator HflK [Marinomonas spartinae]|uniref:protease modulator HflK n=1 Tax=Marinomonas spartinae TaxID=1792290 RepID=UPI0018F141E1|nr:protease modulator HflK [Marinomonas spartinae]MBJ7553541.1 protease modulator HflK [Marinomonas spartinae]